LSVAPKKRRLPIRLLGTTGLGLLLLGLLFWLERLAVTRHLNLIPLRIGVTGTRGKSTVTRFIAASLRESGVSVLAKTTGSKPVIILPSGGEEEIPRRGLPTILEQKKILARAAGLKVRALVVELMSIGPECLAVESRRLLRPRILVMTNVRVDHREELGMTKPEVAGGLACAIPPEATVFILEKEFYPQFGRAAEKAGSRIIRVAESATSGRLRLGGQSSSCPFDEDIALAVAVSEHLGIPRATALRGIAGARPDFGGLRAWEVVLGTSASRWLLASAFSANEPESSGRVLGRLERMLPEFPGGLVGLLNLRQDRGDRSKQWIEAWERGFFSRFTGLYVVGAHLCARSWRRCHSASPRPRPLPAKSPLSVMEKIVKDYPEGGVLVGLGNMGGLGEELVEHWEKIGRPHAL
jgi:poly-gamma-glutamate synthase PgsB/CapB